MEADGPDTTAVLWAHLIMWRFCQKLWIGVNQAATLRASSASSRSTCWPSTNGTQARTSGRRYEPLIRDNVVNYVTVVRFQPLTRLLSGALTEDQDRRP